MSRLFQRWLTCSEHRILFKSLNLAWISRLLIIDPHSPETWKSIPNHFFKKFGGLSFLLRCSYDNKLRERSELPPFYRQILELSRTQDSFDSFTLVLPSRNTFKIIPFFLKWISFFPRNIRKQLENKGMISEG